VLIAVNNQCSSFHVLIKADRSVLLIVLIAIDRPKCSTILKTIYMQVFSIVFIALGQGQVFSAMLITVYTQVFSVVFIAETGKYSPQCS
jgi:hypothetical protein